MEAQVTAKYVDIDIAMYALTERETERIDRGQALKMLRCLKWSKGT